MNTNTQASEARAAERHRRKRARAERRRRDRALAPVTVAQRLGIPVADLARAMRSAGVHEQLTEAQARDWTTAPETAPEWLTVLRGDRLARAAEQEYRRQQDNEQRELRELTAEQSALEKVEAGGKRFSDSEWLYVQDWAFRAARDLVRGSSDVEADDFGRRVLLAVGVDAEDHATWPVHARGCDGEGDAHCWMRMEEMRAKRRADARIESVAKETAVRELALVPGHFVATWHGRRVGVVVKVNKVTVKVRMIGGRDDRNAPVERNLDPRYISPAPQSLPTPPAPGDSVVLRDHGGNLRQAQVIEAGGPLFEATYSLKSGQWRSGWFDLLALQPGPESPT